MTDHLQPDFEGAIVHSMHMMSLFLQDGQLIKDLCEPSELLVLR